MLRKGLTLTALVLAGAAVCWAATEQKTKLHGIGTDTVGLMKSDPTNVGTFDGTWMYVNRDSHFALWIRTKNGKRQAKLQYQSLAGPEAFETDWDGKATYYMAGHPVTFELKLASADANKLSGAWNWDLEIGDSARKEKADIVVYRTVYGRTLQMDFNNYEKTIRKNGVDQTAKVPTSWAWIKVSKRELLWAELPF
ncbi:MAG TPA: hypothetical protein VFV19_03095 [Candidatus Polarisedimenticolaceae bacterium]|nr:hypothetical protein [Candidatus Polarisedimenticolaceae bacterium]